MFLQSDHRKKSMPDFNVQSELSALKIQTNNIRKRSYKPRQSRLDRYTYELLSLHSTGATSAELQRWLRSKRIKVAHSTVLRWLQRHE